MFSHPLDTCCCCCLASEGWRSRPATFHRPCSLSAAGATVRDTTFLPAIVSINVSDGTVHLMSCVGPIHACYSCFSVPRSIRNRRKTIRQICAMIARKAVTSACVCHCTANTGGCLQSFRNSQRCSDASCSKCSGEDAHGQPKTVLHNIGYVVGPV